MMVVDGCAGSGKRRVSHVDGVTWSCRACSISFCEDCVAKYSKVKDRAALEMYPSTAKHLVHAHRLKFVVDSEVNAHIARNCVGKHKKGGCTGQDQDNVRIFMCEPCRVVLCECCYASPAADFLEFVAGDFHDHMLHLTAASPVDKWRCAGDSDGCLKKHPAAIGCKVSYR